MKNALGIFAVMTMLAAPAAAQAEQAAPATPPMAGMEMNGGMMHCPMMGGMHEDMAVMIKEMDSMIGGMSDPAMKDRLQKVRDRMDAMMSGMHHDMGGMPQGDKTQPAEPAGKPEDHEKHHPAQ